MLLPTELFSTASVATAKPNHILLAIDRAGTLIWILEAQDQKYAMFLTGEFAGRAFEISGDSGGSGVLIGPVQVRVEPSSISGSGAQWSLRARDGLLAVSCQAEKRGGFPETVWAAVAPIETSAETTFYFTHWSLGVIADGDWQNLITFKGGEGKTTIQVPKLD